MKLKNPVVKSERPNGRKRIKLMFHDDNPRSQSKTKQAFKKECDINNIMKKYTQTGILGDPAAIRQEQPRFGDFSKVEDFHSSMNKIVEAQNDFNQLSSEVRKRFENDPANLIVFLNNPENEDEARELGFLPPLTDEQLAAKNAQAQAARKEKEAATSGEETPASE